MYFVQQYRPVIPLTTISHNRAKYQPVNWYNNIDFDNSMQFEGDTKGKWDTNPCNDKTGFLKIRPNSSERRGQMQSMEQQKEEILNNRNIGRF